MSEKVAYRWHTTPLGELHKGPSAQCSKCKRGHVVKKTDGLPKYKKKNSGRRPTLPIKKCSECGVPISSDSKTGLCLKHYRAHSALNKKKRRDRKSRHCVNPSCSNHISDSNQTGLCWQCYRDRNVIAEYKAHHVEWTKSLEPLPSRT
jgi:hypothetical protein